MSFSIRMAPARRTASVTASRVFSDNVSPVGFWKVGVRITARTFRPCKIEPNRARSGTVPRTNEVVGAGFLKQVAEPRIDRIFDYYVIAGTNQNAAKQIERLLASICYQNIITRAG